MQSSGKIAVLFPRASAANSRQNGYRSDHTKHRKPESLPWREESAVRAYSPSQGAVDGPTP